MIDLVIDMLWPRLTGEPEKQPNRDEERLDANDSLAEEVKRMLIVRLEQSETRSEAVDRKLLSLFRTTSIFATVSIAIFTGAANLTTLNPDVNRPLVWLSMATILYGFVQLFHATKSTLQGLRASGYERLGKDSLIPTEFDNNTTYNSRQIPLLMNIVEQNEWATNKKVSCMELAYTSIRNALFSLPVLMVLASAIAIDIIGT